MTPEHVRRFLDHTGAAGVTPDDFDEPVERRLLGRTVVLQTVEVDGYGVALLAEYTGYELTQLLYRGDEDPSYIALICAVPSERLRASY